MPDRTLSPVTSSPHRFATVASAAGYSRSQMSGTPAYSQSVSTEIETNGVESHDEFVSSIAEAGALTLASPARIPVPLQDLPD